MLFKIVAVKNGYRIKVKLSNNRFYNLRHIDNKPYHGTTRLGLLSQLWSMSQLDRIIINTDNMTFNTAIKPTQS